MARHVFCKKLNQELEGLEAPPFKGELGLQIFEQISKQAWDQWVIHQTMLINEYRLSAIDPNAKTFLREEMARYFFGEGSKAPAGYVPKAG